MIFNKNIRSRYKPKKERLQGNKIINVNSFTLVSH